MEKTGQCGETASLLTSAIRWQFHFPKYHTPCQTRRRVTEIIELFPLSCGNPQGGGKGCFFSEFNNLPTLHFRSAFVIKPLSFSSEGLFF
jgi:hypothetical protein